jgi:glycerol-3-phosphate dehydrogenase subunit C
LVVVTANPSRHNTVYLIPKESRVVTTIYDPQHPLYLDEADVRNEMNRVYDVCHGCRLCFKFCTSFPTLFSYVDAHDDQDTAKLTKAQQDQVVDECFQCKLCDINCPYTPAKGHEWQLDFPRLMLRADAMRHATKQVDKRKALTTNIMGHTDAVGRVASALAPVANAATGKPGSLMRKVIEKTSGVSSQRLLPPFARQRFSVWFAKRPRVRLANRQAQVTLFPTCLVEYQAPSIGQDLVKVYERNGVECSLAEGASCCGAPFLHSGDLPSFTKVAVKNVATLAASVRAGNDIVVPQPTCSYVLKKDYVEYVGGPDAELVAKHTFDSSEYLIRLHKDDGLSLDMVFPGDVPESVTYHTPCHLRAQNIGLKSRDLMKLTGAKVKLVQQCSGIDGMWGLRAENAHLSIPIGKKLGDEIRKAGGDIVAGDCHLANGVISEQTGRVPVHPIQMIARAYGIGEEPT